MIRRNKHDGPAPIPLVGVVMGSASDLAIMQHGADLLEAFEVEHEVRVVSAHRTPMDMMSYAQEAGERGLKVIIAGAGGAAHLPGMLASVTHLPVIGVPIPLVHLSGLDSLLSIVQMPAGVPVATVGVGNARNAALLAVRILALGDPELVEALKDYREEAASQSRSSLSQLSR